MQKSLGRALAIFLFGVIAGGTAIYFQPQQSVKASVANGNDKFTMVTVPVSIGETEAVFVLNHLTGILSGAVLNPSTARFTHYYLHNVAADFETPGGSGEQKYAIVSAAAPLRTMNGLQPANGMIYIGELSSGRVIGYTFPMPRGPGSPTPIPLAKIAFFPFAESAGR